MIVPRLNPAVSTCTLEGSMRSGEPRDMRCGAGVFLFPKLQGSMRLNLSSFQRIVPGAMLDDGCGVNAPLVQVALRTVHSITNMFKMN